MDRSIGPAHVPCNLCDSREIDELSLRDRRGPYLRTVICRRCGLVWSDPRPSAEQVSRYYTSEYRRDYKGALTPSAAHVLRAARVAVDRTRSLLGWLRPGDSVLDIGAGGAELVYVLRRLGFDARGMEPDAAYAAFVRDQLGVPIENTFAQHAAFAPSRFDVVTMYHTLEHVEDPLAILARVREWLTPDGLLVVEVPNVEAVCQAPAHRFHVAHLYSYNQATLEALGRKAGYSILRTALSQDGGNVAAVLRREPRSNPPVDNSELRGNYDRIVGIIRRHNTFRHYLSATPYARAWRRALRHVEERRTARRFSSPRAIVEGVISQARFTSSARSHPSGASRNTAP